MCARSLVGWNIAGHLVGCRVRVWWLALCLGLRLLISPELIMGATLPNPTPASTTQTTTKPEKVVCIYDDSEKLKQIKQGLKNAFENNKEVDIAILMDRSKSINIEGFDHTVNAMKILLNYLINSGLIEVRIDRARISMLSFGKTSITEVNGFIYDDRTATICKIDDFIAKLQHVVSNETDVYDALKTTSAVFRGSKRNSAKKVLFIFFDGEYNKMNPNDEARNMKADGVEIFSAGVGSPTIKGWMNTAAKENVVAGLATDRDGHYACVEHWENIKEPEANRPLVEGGTPKCLEYSEGACSLNCTDASGVVCACNIPRRQYECVKKDDITCRTTTTPRPGRPPSTAPPDPPLTVLLIAICVPVFIVLVIIIFAIGFVVWRRRKNRPQPGPPLPPPPVRRRLVQPSNNILYGSEPLYGNNPDPPAVMESQAEEVIYEYQKITDIEKEMPGWGEYLIDQARSHGIRHISIHDTVRHRWASTPGKHVRKDEVKELLKTFKMYDGAYVNDKIKVARETFKVDHGASRQSQISGDSTKGDDKVIISQTGDYIVVAIAPPDHSESCQMALDELDRYLMRSSNDDNDETAFDNGDDDVYSDTLAMQRDAPFGPDSVAPYTAQQGGVYTDFHQELSSRLQLPPRH